MTDSTIELPDDPASAVEALRSAAETRPVVVFKKSPVCGVSTSAERRFVSWLEDTTTAVDVAVVDVIAARPLARGLTAELGIDHASPQVLVFTSGSFRAHTSHGGIDAGWLDEAISG